MQIKNEMAISEDRIRRLGREDMQAENRSTME